MEMSRIISFRRPPRPVVEFSTCSRVMFVMYKGLHKELRVEGDGEVVVVEVF